MTLTALPVLLYVIPAVMLLAAVVPPRRKPTVLGLGGLAYEFATGGIAGLTLTLLSVCGAWLVLRLMFSSGSNGAVNVLSGRQSRLRLSFGICWQAALLIAGKFLLTPAALLPVLLCAMFGIECMHMRAAHGMQIPPLIACLNEACSMPHFWAGPVMQHQTMQDAVHTRKVTAEAVGAGAGLCIRGLFQTVLLSMPMMTLLHELDSYVSPLTAADAWLTLIVFYCAVYHGLRGAVRLGVGLAMMLGLQGEMPEAAYPIGAASLKEYWSRSIGSAAAWANRVLLHDVRETDTGRYFVRVLLFFGSVGTLLGNGWCGLFFGAAQAGLLTFSKLPAVSKRLHLLPKLLRQIGTALLVLLGMGLLKSSSLPELFAHAGALLGVNGGSLSGAARYLCGTHAVPLLLSVVLLFPVVPAVSRRIRDIPQVRKAAAICMPAAELGVLLCCMAELLSHYLRG